MEYTVELEKEEIKGNKEIAYILLKSKVPYFVDTDVKDINLRRKTKISYQFIRSIYRCRKYKLHI